MNVEEGHKLGVRHVGGLWHVAPMLETPPALSFRNSGGLHRFVLVRGRAMQRDVTRYGTK